MACRMSLVRLPVCVFKKTQGVDAGQEHGGRDALSFLCVTAEAQYVLLCSLVKKSQMGDSVSWGFILFVCLFIYLFCFYFILMVTHLVDQAGLHLAL